MEDNIYIKIIENFGKASQSFSYKDIEKKIELSKLEIKIIKSHLSNAFRNGIIVNWSTPDLESIFILEDSNSINQKFWYNITQFTEKKETSSLADSIFTHSSPFNISEADLKHNNLNSALKSNYLKEKYMLKPEMVFHYLDYLELKEARINAENAQKNSTNALNQSKLAFRVSFWLALMSAIIGIFSIHVDKKYSKLQLSTPVTLSWSQVDDIISRNNLIIDNIQDTNNLIKDLNHQLNDIEISHFHFE